jgi:hypothetical protein
VYLTAIAVCNGLADPLDRRVVEAYWVGNELLRRVPAGVLSECRTGPLAGLSGRRDAAAGASRRGVPHHSFEVFAIYPWLALLRSGKEQPALEVLDRCRIRWGQIERMAGDEVTVRSRSLVFDGSRLLLGPDRVERVRRTRDGLELAPDVRPGDMVAMHWDWVCDRLSPRSLFWLEACTQRNLDAVNADS